MSQPVPDIDHFTDVNGEVWVVADTGVASTWEALDRNLRGKPWKLASGTPYPDTIKVWSDVKGHWLWEPAIDLRLSEFQEILRTIGNAFSEV